VGSSANVDGESVIGTVIATTTITMTYGSSVSGRLLALNGAVTMITNEISACTSTGDTTPKPRKECRDFVTGGGWINVDGEKATFGVSGGLIKGKYWGNLSFEDHSSPGMKVKSTRVTAYLVIDAVTRQIEGIAKVNGLGDIGYKVIVVDNAEPGRDDSFTLELTNGYTASGTLTGGNITLHRKCDSKENKRHEGEDYDEDEDDDDKKEVHSHSRSKSNHNKR